MGDRSSTGPGPRPRRTCVGCRTTADPRDLLRVVADPRPDGDGPRRALPDPRARAGGRGAWVHPSPTCLDLAERRRAFPRALRVAAPLDLAGVRAVVAVPAPPG